ncbi:hypothetical protein NW762_006336 [Fusarium torreyae]|uniref:Xylanolytic transcriptional activator regulatory domain-containing protein n=1 Tax=Fusarium torreyae TaxID=1237075 RepID=A0A9W8S097_9HYPO|nr:hypothetical protein NW762_006336 [Fusarium torreyae]
MFNYGGAGPALQADTEGSGSQGNGNKRQRTAAIYDPASLTILDRLNHVVSLLESRPSAVLVNDPQSPNSLQETAVYPNLSNLSVDQHLRIAPVRIPDEPTTHVSDEDVLQALDLPGFPSSANSCESILRWPIFEGLVFDVHSFVLESESNSETSRSEIGGSLGRGVQEDDFIPLSKKFLAYVHVKNPILDVRDYKAKVRDAAENGPGWDGPSCLVVGVEDTKYAVEHRADHSQLISCALACLSAPFHSEVDINGTPESTRSSTAAFLDPDTAASYYLAAKKRLGLLQPSLLYIQCLFLCGVYEMYCLRPLQAWFHFNRACVDLRNILWTRSQNKSSNTISREKHRLEQRLYWSCVKSEYELRCEIPLPPSGITHCDYPDMFPSPPTELTSPSAQNQPLDVLEDEIIPEEEKSWFYYLAEISYRRIMNRAMAVMARNVEQGWAHNIRDTMEQCRDFNEQIDIWYSHIPPQIDPKNEDHANNELAQFVKNRAIAFREWIHRPFLFYILHQPPNDPHYEQAMPLAQKCLELCVKHLFRTYGHHRHHGTWYIARACVTRALILLACAKSCRIPMPRGWKDALEIARWTIHRWSAEAPDLQWAETVLKSILGSLDKDS